MPVKRDEHAGEESEVVVMAADTRTRTEWIMLCYVTIGMVMTAGYISYRVIERTAASRQTAHAIAKLTAVQAQISELRETVVALREQDNRIRNNLLALTDEVENLRLLGKNPLDSASLQEIVANLLAVSARVVRQGDEAFVGY